MSRVLILSLIIALSIHATASTDVSTSDQAFSDLIFQDQCKTFLKDKQQNGEPHNGACSLSESGEIGNISNRTYYYALYRLVPSYDKVAKARFYKHKGLAIFVREGSSVDLKLLDRYPTEKNEPTVNDYEKPEIIKNAIGTFLYVPIADSGSAHGNSSEYYLWANEHFQIIESGKWLSDLRKGIPSEVELRYGIWPDIHSMTVKAPLYRQGDEGCCPSAGTVHVILSVKNYQFVIQSMTITPESMTKAHKRKLNN